MKLWSPCLWYDALKDLMLKSPCMVVIVADVVRDAEVEGVLLCFVDVVYGLFVNPMSIADVQRSVVGVDGVVDGG